MSFIQQTNHVSTLTISAPCQTEESLNRNDENIVYLKSAFWKDVDVVHR